MKVSTKIMKLFFDVFHNSRRQGQRNYARMMIEYAIDTYGDKITMTMPGVDRMCVVKQSPLERQLDGGTISFHNLEGV